MSANDIENKRQFVIGLYSGPSWKRRVQKMSDVQVIAIYLREHNKPKKPPKESDSDPAPF
jgi:hypothetical protein